MDFSKIHLYPPVWIALAVGLTIGLVVWHALEKDLRKEAKTHIVAKVFILLLPLAAAIHIVARWVERRELKRQLAVSEQEKAVLLRRALSAQSRLSQLS